MKTLSVKEVSYALKCLAVEFEETSLGRRALATRLEKMAKILREIRVIA